MEASAPKITPEGLTRYNDVPERPELKVPSMCDTSPPVTRAMILLVPGLVEKKAVLFVGTEKAEKL